MCPPTTSASARTDRCSRTATASRRRPPLRLTLAMRRMQMRSPMRSRHAMPVLNQCRCETRLRANSATLLIPLEISRFPASIAPPLPSVRLVWACRATTTCSGHAVGRAFSSVRRMSYIALQCRLAPLRSDAMALTMIATATPTRRTPSMRWFGMQTATETDSRLPARHPFGVARGRLPLRQHAGRGRTVPLRPRLQPTATTRAPPIIRALRTIFRTRRKTRHPRQRNMISTAMARQRSTPTLT